MRLRILHLCGAIALLTTGCAQGDDDVLRVAAAANFATCLAALTADFEQAQGIRVVTTLGSTGKLAAQIRAGAPFDIFLAADTRRPQELATEGFATARGAFSYATGRLAIVSRSAAFPARLAAGQARTLAIANPAVAPYGRAALDWLTSTETPEPERIVRGENVGQALRFATTGAADGGIVSLALARSSGLHWTPIDPNQHRRIDQAAIVVGAGSSASRAFADYLDSPEARAIIASYGYDNAE